MKWSLGQRTTGNFVPRMLIDRMRWETRIRKRPVCLIGDIPGDQRLSHLLGWRGLFWTHAGIRYLFGTLGGTFPARFPRRPRTWCFCAHCKFVLSNEVRLKRMLEWMLLCGLREVRARRVSYVARWNCGLKGRFLSRI